MEAAGARRPVEKLRSRISFFIGRISEVCIVLDASLRSRISVSGRNTEDSVWTHSNEKGVVDCHSHCPISIGDIAALAFHSGVRHLRAPDCRLKYCLIGLHGSIGRCSIRECLVGVYLVDIPVVVAWRQC